MTLTFFVSIGSHSSIGLTASVGFPLGTSFDSFPLLFRVRAKGAGVSSPFFDINAVKDDPDVAVLDMLVVGIALSIFFVSPDVLDAGLSL